jgi:uncharacterized protein (TIGR02646 family)
MRRIERHNLPVATQKALDKRQIDADAMRVAGTLDVEKMWKIARQTKPLKTSLSVLESMAGQRHRCMYCGDSHGTDMEHFWPKKRHPERMFRWPNLLLCCTECGRFKGEQFPMDHGQPLLVDPTAEDPWQFLDFDPNTGNIVARFDVASNDWTSKGTETVKVLHLDRREALAESYQKTYRRLKSLVEAALQQTPIAAAALANALCEADDHGLLGWCFRGTGQNESPFRDLRLKNQAAWDACAQNQP